LENLDVALATATRRAVDRLPIRRVPGPRRTGCQLSPNHFGCRCGIHPGHISSGCV